MLTYYAYELLLLPLISGPAQAPVQEAEAEAVPDMSP